MNNRVKAIFKAYPLSMDSAEDGRYNYPERISGLVNVIEEQQGNIDILNDCLESSAQTNADLTVRLSEEVEKRNELEAKLEELRKVIVP